MEIKYLVRSAVLSYAVAGEREGSETRRKNAWLDCWSVDLKRSPSVFRLALYIRSENNQGAGFVVYILKFHL